MTPLAWQVLLAVEAPAPKARDLLAELRASRLEPTAFLRAHPRLTGAERQRLDHADLRALERALDRGVRVVEASCFDRPEAPLPVACFVAGTMEALRAPSVAIVGTRGASTYGKACARKFAEAAAIAGATVISGGALGIDAAAHEGALEADGRTVAVLGCGVDIVYPATHASLFERIQERGALVSQFACGASPNGYRFIVRNGLIAALANVVLVIEAPEGSGALTTATAAAELGRQVLAVPATIDRHGFRGSHALIRDGAALVDHPDQLLEALGLEPGAPRPSSAQAQSPVLAVLEADPMPTEKIVELTGLDPAAVMAELTMLELDGSVSRDGIGYSRRL
jgi:DNA processing protein